MPAPTEFSWAQRGHIWELEKICRGRVQIVGYDLANRPVIRRWDRNGEATYAIRKDGSGADRVVDPVLEFTIDDAYQMGKYDYKLLIKFCPTVFEGESDD